MDRGFLRQNSTNENAHVLRQKATSAQPLSQAPQRSVLGQISTNPTSLRGKTALTQPPQRVHVYNENDENNVPQRPAKRPEVADHPREPLAEISAYQPTVEENELAGYEEESSEIMEEEYNDEIPQSMMPTMSPEIFQELHDVYLLFYNETLDAEDEDTYDVSMVAEYSPEIFNYLHTLEVKLRPNPRYMEAQTELKWNMRSILIDWLVQVHSRFNLLPETLFLTVNYIDRFLSKRKVSLSRFQLVGAVALFIAAKYEEINCPSVNEIAYMVDHAYSVEDILRAERFMIDVLEFEMGWPGPMSFLRRTSKADDYDFETRTLAKYFLEITVMDYRFVGSPPSWLAAGAHYLSRLLLNRGEWTAAHMYYSGYTADQLRPLAYALLDACRNPEEHHKSIYEKYQERRFRRSSLFVQEWFKLAESG